MLHGSNLGPLIFHIPLVLNLFLESTVFVKPMPYLTVDDTRRIGLLRIKAKLTRLYCFKRRDPTWKKTGSEVWNLTIGMLGPKKRPWIADSL